MIFLFDITKIGKYNSVNKYHFWYEKGVVIMYAVSQDIILAVLRKKGERRMTTSKLASETGINRRTLTKVLNDKNVIVQGKTYTALSEWLAKNI